MFTFRNTFSGPECFFFGFILGVVLCVVLIKQTNQAPIQKNVIYIKKSETGSIDNENSIENRRPTSLTDRLGFTFLYSNP